MSIDVLVVGAGPAGSIAALVLARAGFRVQLIDRAQFPRHKLCGDTLNPGSLALLERLCETESEDLYSSVIRRSLAIRGMTVTGPGGARVTANYPYELCGIAIARRELDQLLLNAAIDAGACFDTGVTATAPLMTDDETRVVGAHTTAGNRRYTIRSRVVIAADGRGSRLASALKLSAFARKPRRWAFGAYFTDVDGLTEYGEMHVRTDGYVGVAPLPRRVTNVCIVRDVHQVRADRIQASTFVRHVIDGDPMLRDRFAAARQISDIVSLGPLAVDWHSAGCPGLLLAGDAAGFVDPMTGDGLRFAFRGGVLAAEAAEAELTGGQPAWRSLTDARSREFTMKWRVNRALRYLVDSPVALGLVTLLATKWDTPVQHLIGVAGDVALARQTQGTRLVDQ